jgi:predicted nucleotidyltransferase
MQSLIKTLETAQKALDQAGVDYALIGGLALGSRGVHRATMDVDLLVDGNKREAAKAALEKNGFQLRAETREVIHYSGIGALDLLLANREPTQKMLEQAQPLPILQIKCVGTEDLIGLKIQAYMNDSNRELQDMADIEALIRKNRELDWTLIKKYADLFGQWPTIDALRKKYDI